MARNPQSASDETKDESKSDERQGDKPRTSNESKDGPSSASAQPKTGGLSVRTKHPRRFGHITAGLAFNPTPAVFKPGELDEDTLKRLAADPLLVIEEV